MLEHSFYRPYVSIRALTAKGVELDVASKFCIDVIREFGGVVRDGVRIETKSYYSMTRFWFRFQLPNFKYRGKYEVKKEIEAVIKKHPKIIKEVYIH